MCTNGNLFMRQCCYIEFNGGNQIQGIYYLFAMKHWRILYKSYFILIYSSIDRNNPCKRYFSSKSYLQTDISRACFRFSSRVSLSLSLLVHFSVLPATVLRFLGTVHESTAYSVCICMCASSYTRECCFALCLHLFVVEIPWCDMYSTTVVLSM